MEEETYKKGVWTPWAAVVCYDCHGNENLPNPKTEEEWEKVTKPQELRYGNAVTFCDDCHTPIQVDESVAYEHNLVAALRECGIEAELSQTGGMCSAASISPSDELRGERGPDDIGEILVTYSFDGDGAYWVGVYDNDFSPVEAEWAGGEGFKSQDEVMAWAFSNQEKLAKLAEPDQDRPLSDIVQKAKEKAAEKNIEAGEKGPPGKGVER